ncbi:DUF1304 domain-containing protein [Deinococcus gobiensis]|nr:DUF1304 domain-containing protein [Deinococcus gobiensis]
MTFVAGLLVAAIALLHVYILVLEMFLWTTPRAMKAFGTTPEFAQATRALAANQGLYNGFLAAGLLWGLVTGSAPVQLFFLGCVAVAGVYGALTSNRRILFIQTVPAVLGLLAVLLAS